MSSYHETTIHPVTGEPQEAFWMDDYFGPRVYGIQFTGEERVYKRHEVMTVEHKQILEAFK